MFAFFCGKPRAKLATLAEEGGEISKEVPGAGVRG